MFYQHFVPDADSVAKKHPMEGLSFMQANLLANNVAYKHNRKDTELENDGCSITYPSTTPFLPAIPIPVSHQFPLLLLQYADHCYGFEDIFTDVQVDSGAILLRKVDEDMETFDSLHIDRTVDLTEADKAECWDIDPSTGKYESDGFVKGTFTWDYTAETLSGAFDLDPANL